MRNTMVWAVFSLIITIGLFSCGGGGSNSITSGGTTNVTGNSSTLSGSVVKGPVTGATVTFYALNADGSRGALLGSTITDGSGNYTITLAPKPTTPFLAVASGGSYEDEATGATSTLLAGDQLRAVLPAGTVRATVTPLTEIATARALTSAATGTPSAAQLAAAVASTNIAVAQQYNLADIVTTLPAPANDGLTMVTATLEEKQYGLVLAGIAQNASTLGVRPIELAAAFAEDAKDGVFDGTNNGVPIHVPLKAGGTYTLPVIAGTQNIQDAINAFIASANNKSGQTQMPVALTPVQLGVNTAGALYTTSSVLPAATSGEPYAAGVTAAGGTKPYKCALKAGSSLPTGLGLSNTCQISGTAPLLGSGTTMSISAPFAITLTDSAVPPASVDMTLYLTTKTHPVLRTTGLFSDGAQVVKTFANGTCTFSIAGSGSYDVQITTQSNGSYAGSATVSGNFASTPVASTGSANCVASSTTWNTTNQISGNIPNIKWNTAFVTPGGTSVTGDFSGTLSGSSIINITWAWVY